MKVSPINLLIVAMVATMVIGLPFLDWDSFLTLPRNALWGLLVLTGVGITSEAFAFSTKVGRSAGNSSLTFLPLVAAVLLFGQAGAVVFVAATGAVAEFTVRRKGWQRSLFNVTQYVLSTAVAGWVFLALGGAPIATQSGNEGFEPQWVQALAFGFVALMANHLAVTAAVLLTRQEPFRRIIWSFFSKIGGTVLYDIAVLPVALLVAYLWQTLNVLGLIIALFPLVFIRHSYLSKYRLEIANRDLLKALVKAIETRDPYTSGHAVRVQDLAIRIGTELRLRPGRLDDLQAAALLHDIGKIEVVYEQILMKPSSLSATERKIIESHVQRGVDILTSLSSFSQRVIEGVRHHHELYDGTGYPDQLRGDDIPLFGRIIKTSDAIDAMLSDRPYRKALTLTEVREELEAFRGRHFDPRIVDIVVATDILDQHELQMRAANLVNDEPVAASQSQH